MKIRFITVFTLVILTLFSGAHLFSSSSQWKDSDYNRYNYKSFYNLSMVNKEVVKGSIDYKLLNAAVFYSTNEMRLRHGRRVFKYSPALEKAAFDHSVDMVRYNFFSHFSTVQGKRRMVHRLRIVGITNSWSAENIANTFARNETYLQVAKKLVKGWMNSPGHRKNILNRRYTYLGCGSYYYYNPRWSSYMWFKSTQNFSSKYGKKINAKSETKQKPKDPFEGF